MKKNAIKSLSLILFTAMLLQMCGCTVSVGKYRYSKSSEYTQAQSGSFQNITEIDIDWVGGGVLISGISEDKVAFFEEDTDNHLCYRVKDGKLTLKFAKSGTTFTSPDKKVVITVPESIKNIKINSVSADIGISGYESEKTEINTVSGNIYVNSDSTEDLTVKTVSGNIETIAGKTENFSAKSVSGEISFSGSMDSGKLETVSGDVNIEFLSEKGFDIKTDTVSGRINIQDKYKKDITAQGKNYIYGNGENQISVKTVSGNITVN